MQKRLWSIPGITYRLISGLRGCRFEVYGELWVSKNTVFVTSLADHHGRYRVILRTIPADSGSALHPILPLTVCDRGPQDHEPDHGVEQPRSERGLEESVFHSRLAEATGPRLSVVEDDPFEQITKWRPTYMFFVTVRTYSVVRRVGVVIPPSLEID